MRIGFVLATGFAGLLFVMGLVNWIANPAAAALKAADQSEYS